MALVQSNLLDDDDDAEAAHHLSLIMYSVKKRNLWYGNKTHIQHIMVPK